MDLFGPSAKSYFINLMHPEVLVNLLEAKYEMLVIDCRSYMEYHTSNIQSSINIGGNRLVRRRLMQGKVTVSELIKKRFEGDVSFQHVLDPGLSVVVYDQCTDDVAYLREECFVYAIIKQLKLFYNNVYLLKGSISHFMLGKYPKMEEDFVDPSRSSNGSEEDLTSTIHKKIDTPKGLTSRTGGLTPEPRPGYKGIQGNPSQSLRFGTTPPDSDGGKYQSLSGPALPVTNPGPTEILPYVILGCQADAMSGVVLRNFSITHVLNVSADGPACPHIPKRHFLRIPVNDNYCDRLLPHLQRAFEFLNEARDAKGRALIHCSAGISRSPTVAIAYLMKQFNMSMKEAYDFVKLRRPTVSPNFNFLGQLLELERQNQHTIPASPAQVQSGVDRISKTKHPAALIITGSSRSFGSSKRRERPLQQLFSMSNRPRNDENNPAHRTRLLPSPSDELRSLADIMLGSGYEAAHNTSGSSALTSLLSRGSQSNQNIPTIAARSVRLRSPQMGSGCSRLTRSRSPLTSIRSCDSFSRLQQSMQSPICAGPAMTFDASRDDPLSQFPSVSLDQLHFQPCSTAFHSVLSNKVGMRTSHTRDANLSGLPSSNGSSPTEVVANT